MTLLDYLRGPNRRNEWDSRSSSQSLDEWLRSRDPREQRDEDHINQLWDGIRSASGSTPTTPATRQRDKFGRFVRRGG